MLIDAIVSFVNSILIVDAQRHQRFVGLGVETYGFDAADHDPGRLHRRAQLEAADVVEARLESISGRVVERQQVADLERHEQDRAEADRDEDADPEVDCRTIHWPPPRNMNTVMTKSSARIASDDMTTVRVVAIDTPSAVGLAS